MEYLFTMIESTSRQIIPKMSWNGNSGITTANVPQKSLALDSGATIHFFSNQDLLQSIKATKSMKIHYGGTTFGQAMIGRLQDELKHLLLQKKRHIYCQGRHSQIVIHREVSERRIIGDNGL